MMFHTIVGKLMYKLRNICKFSQGLLNVLYVLYVFAHTLNYQLRNHQISINICFLSQGVITCCAILKQRMAPIRAKLVNPTWIDLVNKCLSQRIVLSEKAVYVLFIVISSLFSCIRDQSF